MSTDTLQEIAHVIKDTHADVHIIGGEPTLVSINTHQQYLSILSTLKNSRIMIVTALQNARAVKVARLYQNIATSYDPGVRTEINNNSINDNNINNSIINNNNINNSINNSIINNNNINTNINTNNNNTNTNKWLARCRELREQGHNLHVCVSLSQSVIFYGLRNILDDLYQYGFKSVHLAAMVPTPNALNETPDPMITSQAMIASAKWVLDKRKTDKNINIFVSPFDGLSQGMSHYEGLSCPAGQSCVNIEPNGQIHACVAKGGEVSSEISSEISGNVKDIKGGKDIKNINNNQTPPIKEQLSSNAYRLEVAQHNRARTQCLGCEFWTTCKGGCRVLANTEIAKRSPECAGFKTFLNYVKEQATS
jgi:radical SAM protein with 4Fe4S-binding SPASM domain